MLRPNVAGGALADPGDQDIVSLDPEASLLAGCLLDPDGLDIDELAEQGALAILRHLEHQGAQIKRPVQAILEIVQELAKGGLLAGAAGRGGSPTGSA
jgi:hypothetical protein